MGDLIPHLRDLVDNRNGWRDLGDFAETFGKLHDGRWSVAEQHWEVVVARVLRTDAVAADASGREAMRQAVLASITLLLTMESHGRCPLCPAPPATVRPDAAGRRPEEAR
jgi:hypothetical protein